MLSALSPLLHYRMVLGDAVEAAEAGELDLFVGRQPGEDGDCADGFGRQKLYVIQ